MVGGLMLKGPTWACAFEVASPAQGDAVGQCQLMLWPAVSSSPLVSLRAVCPFPAPEFGQSGLQECMQSPEASLQEGCQHLNSSPWPDLHKPGPCRRA